MKITRLRATNVHGYLPIDIVFYPELTFLTGLNGSGKTSALRLLMALLTPSIDEFAAISFSTAAVTVEDKGSRIEVSAQKEQGALVLAYDDKRLELSSSELQLLVEIRRRDEPARNPIFEKVIASEVYQFLHSLSTPMFLGIDRRYFASGNMDIDSQDLRRRQLMHRSMADEIYKGGSVTSLADVNFLVTSRMQQIRAAQEKLDEDLRRRFFTKAFEYKPAGLGKVRGPTRAELEAYREHLQSIQTASEALKVPLPDIQESLIQFFERMSTVVSLLERNVPSERSTQRSPASRPRGKKWEEPPQTKQSRDQVEFQNLYVEWLINSPQADRILEHLKLLHEYDASRKALRDPIDRFLSLVNSFLEQTKKSVEVAATGDLAVTLLPSSEPRSIAALSSGERQLLVMLAHLSLNPNLAGSGVFIVDEPELSLHIDWQEKFVDAVRKANPSVQLILATHSPAIILDRDDVCVSLNAC